MGRDRPQGNPCELCGVQSGAGTGLFSEYFRFSPATVIPPSLRIHSHLDTALGLSITETSVLLFPSGESLSLSHSHTHAHARARTRTRTSQMYLLGSDLCYCQRVCLDYLRLDSDAVYFRRFVSSFGGSSCLHLRCRISGFLHCECTRLSGLWYLFTLVHGLTS
jgi:hypothetical protein